MMNNEKLWDLVQEVRGGGEGTIELNEKKLAILDGFNVRKEDLQSILSANSVTRPPGGTYWR